MRHAFTALLSLVLVVSFSLFTPSMAWAKHKLAFGSLTITKITGGAGLTDLHGFALMTNPGLVKNITLPFLPPPLPFTFPVVVDQDDEHPSDKDLDTLIVLTNSNINSSITILLTLRDSAGVPQTLTNNTFTIDANATLVIFLSSLL